MKKIVLFLFIQNFFVPLFSQNANKNLPTQVILKQLKTQCDSLSEVENYITLKSTAQNALALTNKNDYANLSLFNYYIGVSLENLTNRDSAIYWHQLSLQYATQGNVSKRKRVAYQRLLFLYHSNGNEEKANATANELLKIIDTTTNKIWQYEIYSFLGNYYNEKSLFEKNIEYLIKSIAIQKELLKNKKESVDISDIGITSLNIAKAYIDMQQPDKAIEYITPARGYFDNYLSGLTYYYKNFIDAFLLKKNTTKAFLYYDTLSSLVLSPKAGAFEWSDKIASDLAFAEYYLTQNKMDSALVFASKANNVANDKKSDYIKAQIDFELGKIYAAKKEYNKAIPLLLNAEPITRKANLLNHASLLLTLAQCYAATNQMELSNKYYAKYTPLNDSLNAEISKKNIAQAEAKYQNKQKQQEIENKNLQIKSNRNKIIALIIGLLLLATTALFLLKNIRNKKKNQVILNEKNNILNDLNNQLEEANQAKAKLFSIISHDLRSPISQVYQFLKLQQLNPLLLNSEQKNELSNKIQMATGSLLETMEDLLLWSKTQMNNFIINNQNTFVLPIIESCINLLKLNSESKNIKYNVAVAKDVTIVTDAYFLQTIFRNLLQNAIKASPQNSLIEIVVYETENHYLLYIKNKGQQFTQQQYQAIIDSNSTTTNLNGFGLKLVDELSKKINATIAFKKNEIENTTVEIKFLK